VGLIASYICLFHLNNLIEVTNIHEALYDFITLQVNPMLLLFMWLVQFPSYSHMHLYFCNSSVSLTGQVMFHIMVFCVMILFIDMVGYQCFRGPCCLEPLQCEEEMEAA